MICICRQALHGDRSRKFKEKTQRLRICLVQLERSLQDLMHHLYTTAQKPMLASRELQEVSSRPPSTPVPLTPTSSFMKDINAIKLGGFMTPVPSSETFSTFYNSTR